MFLATTALSEFWDKKRRILFLGSWCMRYDRWIEWEGLNYQVLPSPWDDRKRFYNACAYVDECYERMLAHLADYLNAAHHVSFSRRYWRIIIGPWLLRYLHAAYDRYAHLSDALTKYPKVHTVVLDPRSFRVPKDTLEFTSLVTQDPYNLQIFSQQLRTMGYSFPMQALGARGSKSEVERGNRHWRQTVMDAGKWGYVLALRVINCAWRSKWRVALHDMYWPLSQVWSLAWRTSLRAMPCGMKKAWPFTISDPVFDERRNNLAALSAFDEFERIFVQSLPQNFPTLYLESYDEARNASLRIDCRLPAIVVSAVAWKFDEQFKFVAAEASERGSRLVTVQHGGGYGSFRFIPTEKQESLTGNTFIDWGWRKRGMNVSKTLPDPKLSLLLSNQLDNHYSQMNENILFVATSQPRYLYMFYSAPVGSQWEEYFEWELRFLTALPDQLRSTLTFRPYKVDYGHAVRERISERFADVRWDNCQSIQKALRRSRLVVIDHPMTTFLETLVANIPTTLFWDPDRWEVRDEAEPYFKNLREAGILWDAPEAAAAKVAAIYDDPWAWWGSPDVQEVRRTFVDRYAFARENWVDYWKTALEEEIALSRVRNI